MHSEDKHVHERESPHFAWTWLVSPPPPPHHIHFSFYTCKNPWDKIMPAFFVVAAGVFVVSFFFRAVSYILAAFFKVFCHMTSISNFQNIWKKSLGESYFLEQFITSNLFYSDLHLNLPIRALTQNSVWTNQLNKEETCWWDTVENNPVPVSLIGVTFITIWHHSVR